MNNEGWGWPMAGMGAHYFVDEKSLCRRWAFKGKLRPADGGMPRDACIICAYELGKREGKKEDVHPNIQTD